MTLSRDSMVWWFGLGGSVITALALQLDNFPWLSENARHWISFAAVIVAAVSGKLATSPLAGKEATDVGKATTKVVEAERQLEQVKDAVEEKDAAKEKV